MNDNINNNVYLEIDDSFRRDVIPIVRNERVKFVLFCKI